MKAILFLATIFFSTFASAKLSKPDWVLKKGKLTYHVNYTLKKVEGSSEAAKGKGHCEKGLCQFLVAVPVKSFISGDGNRDNHMLEVTKGALNPMISMTLHFTEPAGSGKIDARAELNFAGKSKTFEHVVIEAKLNENEAMTTGTVPLVLSDFEVERPSLLAIKIDDAVPVDFEMVWN